MSKKAKNKTKKGNNKKTETVNEEKFKEIEENKATQKDEKIEKAEIEDEDEVEEKDILAETLKERKKMTKEVKGKITSSVFANIIMVIIMMLINLCITVLFAKYSLEKFQQYMKIIQICVCIATIVIFEYSYRKDSFRKALYGIEFLVFSVAVLYVPYMYALKGNLEFMDYIIKVFIIYYIIKSLVLYIYTKRKFSKENLSDVKEIVKKEEKEGYLDD